MTIHHLNCATMHPLFPRLHVATYCLLVETDQGLVLVDTGFGLGDYANPTRLMRIFTALAGSPRDPEETAARQVERLGFAREDVRHIAMTHLHLDHSGGLPDFPHAQVHLLRPEYRAAMGRNGLKGRLVYVPAHWVHGPRWVLHRPAGERWFGFKAVRLAPDLSPEVWLIPLAGHTPGHCGVAVERPGGWLLHAGDALPFGGLDSPAPERLSRFLLGPHGPRLRTLAEDHADQIQIVSAHLPLDAFNAHRNF